MHGRQSKGGRQMDIIIENHGTIFLLRAVTQQGQVWLETNLDQSGEKWGEAYVVEHRYAEDIALGAVRDGLKVS
jgi:hypothetical protein